MADMFAGDQVVWLCFEETAIYRYVIAVTFTITVKFIIVVVSF